MPSGDREKNNEMLTIICITLGILGILFSLMVGVGLILSILSLTLFVILKFRTDFNRQLISALILSIIGLSLSSYVLSYKVEEGAKNFEKAIKDSQEMLFKVMAKDTAYNEKLAKELTKIDHILNELPIDSMNIDSITIDKDNIK